jgi:succinate dehydrogenase flavin-adding protein (antitoxin of CptAB toxin-antitoxin module)
MQQQQFLSEDELDAIYKYLAISIDDMPEEEKNMWQKLLEQVDPDFDDMDDEETNV